MEHSPVMVLQGSASAELIQVSFSTFSPAYNAGKVAEEYLKIFDIYSLSFTNLSNTEELFEVAFEF